MTGELSSIEAARGSPYRFIAETVSLADVPRLCAFDEASCSRVDERVDHGMGAMTGMDRVER